MDYIIRNFPETGKVRAILVYPMNALINSQALALERFMSDLPSHIPRIRFARYTGQEAAAEKAQLQQSPPHILLTNYVMLELMLTRPAESPFVNQDQTALQFIAYLPRQTRCRCCFVDASFARTEWESPCCLYWYECHNGE